MAHAIFAAEVQRRGLLIDVCSASTWNFEGDMAAIDARLTCERHQTPMPKLLSTPLRKLDLSNATRVFVMERVHISEVLAATGLPPERVTLLGALDPEQGDEEIADPIAMGPAAFEACYTRIRKCILHYLEITPDLK
jgi:protein-tyrosine-phosphatase